MKQFKKVIVISIVFIFMASFLYSTAMGQSHERPEGEDPPPPMGTAYQSDAQGIKLNGWICAEAYNYSIESNTHTVSGIRIIARLRKGNDIGTFFKTLAGPIKVEYIEEPREAAFNVLGPDVIEYFFGEHYCYAGSEKCTPDKSELEIKLKWMKNIKVLDESTNDIIIRDDPGKMGIECTAADGTVYRTELDENCDNGVDDDGDGLVDGDDPICDNSLFWFIADMELVVR